MAYNWDLDCLVQGRPKIEKLYKEEKDENEKDYYKLLLNHIDMFLKTEYKTTIKNISSNKRLQEITEDIAKYRDYYSLAMNFMDIVHQRKDCIDDLEEKLCSFMGDSLTLKPFFKISENKNHAMSLTNKFYKSFSESLYPYFKQAYKQRYMSVIFSDQIEENIDASSTYFDILNKYFIKVSNATGIPIVYSIIHEYGHVLSRILNPRAVLLDNNIMFDEVCSIFPELIAKYENVGNYERIISLFDLYTDFINYTNMADCLAYHIPLANLWLDYDKKTCKNFYKIALQDYNCDKEKIEEILSADIFNDGSYTTSFLVAVELFNMYKKNREEALKLFNEILRIPYNESVLDFVKNNMQLAGHLGEETDVVVEQLSLELKRKGF